IFATDSFKVVVTNTSLCSDTSDSWIKINVDTVPSPVLIIEPTLSVYTLGQVDTIRLVGFPYGGVFSGNGVTFRNLNNQYYFNPNAVGVGSYPISYEYTNSFGCKGVTTKTLTIQPPVLDTIPGIRSYYCTGDPSSFIFFDTVGVYDGLFYTGSQLKMYSGSSYEQTNFPIFQQREIVEFYENLAYTSPSPARIVTLSPDSVKFFSNNVGQIISNYNFYDFTFDSLLSRFQISTVYRRPIGKFKWINPFNNQLTNSVRTFCRNTPAFVCTGDEIANGTFIRGRGILDAIPGDNTALYIPDSAYQRTVRLYPSLAHQIILDTIIYETFLADARCKTHDTVVFSIYPTPILKLRTISGNPADTSLCQEHPSLIIVPDSAYVAGKSRFLIDNRERFPDANGNIIFLPDSVRILAGTPSGAISQHILHYEYTNDLGCTSVERDTIRINPTPTLQFNLFSPSGFDVISNQRSYCFHTDTIDIQTNQVNLTASNFFARGFGRIAGINNNTLKYVPSKAYYALGASRLLSQKDTIYFYYQNSFGCRDTIEYYINITPRPIDSIIGFPANRQICQNASILSLTPVSTANNVSPSLFSHLNNIVGLSYIPRHTGIDTVRLQITDGKGCVSDTTYLIRVDTLPSTKIIEVDGVSRIPGNQYSYCINENNFSLKGNFLGAGASFRVGTTLLVSDTGSISLNPHDLAFRFGFRNADTSSISIIYSYTDANTCKSEDTLHVRILPLPEVRIEKLKNQYCYDAFPDTILGFPQINAGDSAGFSSRWGTSAIVNLGDKMVFLASQNAQSAGAASAYDKITTDTITYTFRTSQGCRNQTSLPIRVLPKPTLSVIGLRDEDSLCLKSKEILLQGFPNAGGFGRFSGAGLLSDGRTFRADSAGTGKHQLSWAFRNLEGCDDTLFFFVTVNPNPIANFRIENFCSEIPIQFTDLSTVNPSVVDGKPQTIVSWLWNFGDSISSIQQNPLHQYNKAGIYNITLKATTQAGCTDDTVFRNVRFGGAPTANFGSRFFCFTDTTIFMNLTTKSFSGDIVSEYVWIFGNDTIRTPNENPIKYRFPSPGNYPVRLIANTDRECSDDTTATVSILPSIATFPYTETFESGNQLYVAGGDSSTWILGNSPDTTQIPNISQKFWVTQRYKRNERSFVDLPCFNLSSLQRPMISMDIAYNTTPNTDGAVLEFSNDGGITWQLLGRTSDPYNWYNSTGVASVPGSSQSGINPIAWTGNSNGWITARNYLDYIPNKQQVRFRISFGADANADIAENGKPRVGFAFDNITICERSRKVAMEYFAFAPSQNSLRAQKFLYSGVLQNPVLQKDAYLIQYHTDFAQTREDIFNLDNTADPSARALFYGAKESPRIYINGKLFEYNNLFLDTNIIRREALSDAEVQILKPTIESLPTGGIRVKTTFTPLKKNKDEWVVHFAVLEKDIERFIPALNATEQFRFVLKKMLPDAAGYAFRPLELDSGKSYSISSEWTLSSVYNVNKVAVVAWIQNSRTREIYQIAYAEPATTLRKNETGFKDISTSADVMIFPNPASDLLYLIWDEPLSKSEKIVLSNTIGQILLESDTEPGTNGISLNISHLPEGIYLLQKEGIYIGKVLIQR
ncbi:MAG: PKD domain-containing protein, partial [Cytophagales bacterium]|nr:PKD domain-containing protein [Cytophagales bacterium]MDW8384134.1 PKD domain-containing protein [Flammeovirgaceae bacterium]